MRHFIACITGAIIIAAAWPAKAQEHSFSALFYNVENYFDYKNDTLQNDEEYLPESMRRWDRYKFYDKRNKIAKVLIAAGKWNVPSIIGLAEVESRYAMESLAFDSPLKKLNYKIIHKESPDRRGIDVALLYKPETFEPVDTHFYRVDYPFAPEKTTRDILHAVGKIGEGDTLHVFVNHWPSRWGGQVESQPKRIAAARTLRKAIDSLQNKVPAAKILIMGDLNDYPDNKSIAEVLRASKPAGAPQAGRLYNLSWPAHKQSNTGSHKYKGEWGMLDQVIVSGTLLQKQASLRTSEKHLRIVRFPFLLEKDDKYVGHKPYRTYIGFRFHGGFSDHLPVYLPFTLD